jgi:hypothetical protein
VKQRNDYEGMANLSVGNQLGGFRCRDEPGHQVFTMVKFHAVP